MLFVFVKNISSSFLFLNLGTAFFKEHLSMTAFDQTFPDWFVNTRYYFHKHKSLHLFICTNKFKKRVRFNFPPFAAFQPM